MVTAYANKQSVWLQWMKAAFRATYGYELQGANLILARVNLLYTFIEYFSDEFECFPAKKQLEEVADIVAWNTWQMDGLTGRIPSGVFYQNAIQLSLFSECRNERRGRAPKMHRT